MCKNFIQWTMHNSPTLQHAGLTIIRISIGITFIIFGYNKLLSGTTHLVNIGSAMSLFGIQFGHLLWGYLAALTELCTGIAYMFGFCTRIASLPLICLLIVALRFHFHHNDPFSVWAFAGTCLGIAIGFFIAGSGYYSVDSFIHTNHSA